MNPLVSFLDDQHPELVLLSLEVVLLGNRILVGILLPKVIELGHGVRGPVFLCPCRRVLDLKAVLDVPLELVLSALLGGLVSRTFQGLWTKTERGNLTLF